jgi:hypothetical protein
MFTKPVRYTIAGGAAAITLALVAQIGVDAGEDQASASEETTTTTVPDECFELLAYGVEIAPTIDAMSTFGTDPELLGILDRLEAGDVSALVDGPPLLREMADELRDTSEVLADPPEMLKASFSIARDGFDLVADGLDRTADGMEALDIDEMTEGMEDVTEGSSLIEEATGMLEDATAACNG